MRREKGKMIGGRYRVFRPTKAQVATAFASQSPDGKAVLPTSKCATCGQYNSHDARCSERFKNAETTS